jgi:hypothetical protein
MNMRWLENGSKTLVACIAMSGVAAMACFKVITGQEALGMVGLIWAGYTTVNVVQNGKAGQPATPEQGGTNS